MECSVAASCVLCLSRFPKMPRNGMGASSRGASSTAGTERRRRREATSGVEENEANFWAFRASLLPFRYLIVFVANDRSGLRAILPILRAKHVVSDFPSSLHPDRLRQAVWHSK